MMNVEFRDGLREVPDHVAALMAPLETHRMTYDEARAHINNDLLSDRLASVQAKVVSDHLVRHGGS